MTNYPLISIIFPNFNGGKEPLDCLSSINNLKYPKNKLEVIIVDNHSTDGSDTAIKKQFPKVNLLKMTENLGFAEAINTGIKHARGKYIFIANDDLVFEKNSLKILINFLVQHANIGIIGGKIYYKYKPDKIASGGYLMNKWTGNIYPASDPDIAKEPDWLQGCAVLIPKSVFNKIGLLDPGYILSFDDFDLCQRAKNAGYKIVYLPYAVFWHGESLTVNRNKPHKYFHWYKSKFRFILKHLPPINILSIFIIQILIISPFRAIILHDGRFIPFLKGLYWNIKNFPQTIALRKIKP